MAENEYIEQIRRLLAELESELSVPDEDTESNRNFDALELPSLVEQIVDHLHPLLTPLEVAVYWQLFRQSIIAHGQQLTRASVRGLQSGTVLSNSGQSDNLSYKAVQRALVALEEKRALSKVGDTTRKGTLYRISLPEEIPACVHKIKLACDERAAPSIDETKELDYYNIRENRLRVFERDDYRCHYCDKQLTRFSATLDHIQPVSEGGNNSLDNLITACLHCNSRRGSTPVSDFLGGESPSDDD